ncbi:unnamed protein product [Protopolystoma xenopodis]|uniref:Uncharacterized protein n=1 Tax=Protopolystoma xenopodis TaxID=117903 RepID=A0A3S5A1Y4_9PLAT|nr:unnamed protein product [Protopolystoma xenopodis]
MVAVGGVADVAVVNLAVVANPVVVANLAVVAGHAPAVVMDAEAVAGGGTDATDVEDVEDVEDVAVVDVGGAEDVVDVEMDATVDVAAAGAIRCFLTVIKTVVQTESGPG